MFYCYRLLEENKWVIPELLTPVLGEQKCLLAPEVYQFIHMHVRANETANFEILVHITRSCVPYAQSQICIAWIGMFVCANWNERASASQMRSVGVSVCVCTCTSVCVYELHPHDSSCSTDLLHTFLVTARRPVSLSLWSSSSHSVVCQWSVASTHRIY